MVEGGTMLSTNTRELYCAQPPSCSRLMLASHTSNTECCPHSQPKLNNDCTYTMCHQPHL